MGVRVGAQHPVGNPASEQWGEIDKAGIPAIDLGREIDIGDRTGQFESMTQGGKSGVGAFIFAGEGGTITAWAPTVAPTAAFVVFDSGSSGAVSSIMASITAWGSPTARPPIA